MKRIVRVEFATYRSTLLAESKSQTRANERVRTSHDKSQQVVAATIFWPKTAGAGNDRQGLRKISANDFQTINNQARRHSPEDEEALPNQSNYMYMHK